ncbi:MAG: AAA family ATPase [Methylococcales bacterium]|nr:AAA family ATPase [Methylococcales bacterium]
MDNHFLTEIEIEKFKCFSNFKAEGFKRVNLIGGKNNVGKTAFMEACYVNVFSTNIESMITSIASIKGRREKANLVYEDMEAQSFLDSIRHYEVVSNVKAQKFSVLEGNGKKEYQFDIDGKFASINAKEINISIVQAGNIDLIDSFGRSDIKLIQTFQTIQKLDKENELNSFISEFDNSIESFKVIGDKPQCKVNGEYRDITEFGDGLKHYISIICGLYACENGYLFIDEIGNGIHYTQHDRLWELILTLSKKTNCQVFAITHSKEMLESFARVAKKLDEQDISYTTLVKNKQQEIKAITQDCEMLLYSMSQEHEVR